MESNEPFNESGIGKIIENTLSQLFDAEKAMNEPTKPGTPLIRYKRFFWIYPNIAWPGSEDFIFRSITPYHVTCDGNKLSYQSSAYKTTLIVKILQLCQYKPRKLLSVLKRIQVTIEWCKARTAGKNRAAQEILRQQADALRRLDEEAAIIALKG